MKLKTLKETAPWNWPAGSDTLLLSVLNDPSEDEAERVLAAELASDLAVIGESLVEALLTLTSDSSQPEALRGQAAISLGPVLELCDIDGFEDPTDVPICEATYLRVQDRLASLFCDLSIPKEIRRRILEASARAEQDWHHDAIHQAFQSGDPNWQLTAVFCMGYVEGFNVEVMKALGSQNTAIQYLAISAAGVWQIDEAWPLVLQKLNDPNSEKPIVLAAIDAIAALRPAEAEDALASFLDDDDEDIVEAAGEAIGVAEEHLKSHGELESDPQSGDNTLN